MGLSTPKVPCTKVVICFWSRETNPEAPKSAIFPVKLSYNNLFAVLMSLCIIDTIVLECMYESAPAVSTAIFKRFSYESTIDKSLSWMWCERVPFVMNS